jgi:hypothetical protein
MLFPGVTEKISLRGRFKLCDLEFSFTGFDYWALTYQLREMHKVVMLQPPFDLFSKQRDDLEKIN